MKIFGRIFVIIFFILAFHGFLGVIGVLDKIYPATWLGAVDNALSKIEFMGEGTGQGGWLSP